MADEIIIINSSDQNSLIINEQTSSIISVYEGAPGIKGNKGDKGDKGDIGPSGLSGYSPVLTWNGDKIEIDGISGPSLTGPIGPSGHSPNINWIGDQLVIDGQYSPPLTGPQGIQGESGQNGIAPTVTMEQDQLLINGVITGPHLTGPTGASGYSPNVQIIGDQVVIDGVYSDHLTGPSGIQGPSGLSGLSPTVTVIGDQISINGVITGPHLTGPSGERGPGLIIGGATGQYLIKTGINDFEVGWIYHSGDWNTLANKPSGFNPNIHGNELHTTPFGDMFKSIYDSNNNNIVDSSEKILTYAHFQDSCLRGDPVYITAGVQAGTIFVGKADASDSNKMPAVGVALEDSNGGETKRIIILGGLDGLYTNIFNLRDDLYVANGGGLTNVPPANTQYIGTVLRVGGGDGIISVNPDQRKEIQNFNELAQLESTALIEGCELSINGGDPSKYDMSAGVGIIVDNYTNPNTPVKTIVNIPARTGISPDYLLTDSSSYVFANTSGDLIYTNYGSDPLNRRELISIGWIDHTDNATINETKVQPFSPTAPVSQLNDFFLAFGAFNINGNTYGAHTGLMCSRSAGNTFDSNANYVNERRSPHILTSNYENEIDIYYYNRSGIGNWINDNPATKFVDPNYYDNVTGLIPVPSGLWTIQVLAYYAQINSHDFQYGQTLYSGKASALSALQDAVDINPYNSYDTFRGWLVVKQGASDLTDPNQAEFRAAGKLGLFDVAAGGGIGGEINTASNIGQSGYGLYHEKVGVDLRFKNIVSANNQLVLTDDITHHNIIFDINIPTGNSAAYNISTTGLALNNEVVRGDDIRLTGYKYPLNHAISHKTGGLDSIRLDEFDTPTDNTNLNATISYHGLLPKLSNVQNNYLNGTGGWSIPSGENNTVSNIGNSGFGIFSSKVGTDLKFKNITSSNSVLSISNDTTNNNLVLGINLNTGTVASYNVSTTNIAGENEIVKGSDIRLTGYKYPLAHAINHKSGQSDELHLDEFGIPSDNTNLNATTSYHGLLPKLDGSTTKYLNGAGAWTTPAGGGGSSISCKIISGFYEITPSDSVILTDTNFSGFNVLLPNVTGNNNFKFTINNIGSNNLVIIPSGALIDNSNSFSLINDESIDIIIFNNQYITV